MAASLNSEIDVQIYRNTQVVDVQDFNQVLFLTDDKVVKDRVSEYYGLTDLISAGYTTNSKTYLAAKAYFSQNPRPTKILIGRQGATVVTFSMDPLLIKKSTTYSVTVQGVLFTSVATAATAEDSSGDRDTAVNAVIVDLQSKVAAESDVTDIAAVGAIAGAAGTTNFAITQTAAAGAIDATALTVSGPVDAMVQVVSGQESIATAIAEVEATNNKWYMLAYHSHVLADVILLAGITEALSKLYITSTSHVDSYNVVNDTTPATANDVIGKLYEAKYDRTVSIFHGAADSDYIELGVLGKKAPATAGSTTWKYTSLSGIVQDNLTATQSQNIRNKNGNTYETMAAINVLREGKVASGEFIDIMRGADDLHARIQTALFRAMVITANSGSKIGLSDAGVSILTSLVETELQRSQESNFIKQFVKYTDEGGVVRTAEAFIVSAGLVGDLSANDRADRQTPTISFSAALEGAAHKVTVRGSLYV